MQLSQTLQTKLAWLEILRYADLHVLQPVPTHLIRNVNQNENM